MYIYIVFVVPTICSHSSPNCPPFPGFHLCRRPARFRDGLFTFGWLVHVFSYAFSNNNHSNGM